MSSWFKRKNKGIQTPTVEKKDVPKGLWYKTPSGKVIDSDELKVNLYVSPEDGYHVRIGSAEYFEILFDDNKFKELDVLAPSFALAMIVGYIVSKIFPAKNDEKESS